MRPIFIVLLVLRFADESIVNVVIFLLATPLLKMMPCGTLCMQVSSRTCDRVAGPSLCKSSGWRTNPARMRCTSCFLSYHLSKGVHKCSTQGLRSNALGMLCIVISAPR